MGSEEKYAWMRERQQKVKSGATVRASKRAARSIRHGKLATYAHHKCRCEARKMAAWKYSHDHWKEARIRVTPEERKAGARSSLRDSLEILRDTTWKYSGAAETKRQPIAPPAA